MKLKHICSYLGILLISAFVYGMAVSAENAPTYFVEEQINSDSTISIRLSFTPNVAAAGTIKLAYNTNSLELQSADKGSADAQMININAKENGIISVNFLNAYGAVTENTELAVIVFSLKANQFVAEDISFDSFKLYDIDSNLLSDNTTTELIYSVDQDNAPSNIEIVSRQPSNLQQSVQNDVSNIQSSATAENTVSEISTVSQENTEIQPSEVSEIEKVVSDSTEKSTVSVSENVSTVSSETSVMSEESRISETSVFEVSTTNQENSTSNTAVIFIVVGVVVLVVTVSAIIIIKNNRRQSK